MNFNLRRILILLLSVVFVGSCGAAALQLVQYHLGDRDYAQAEEMVNLPDLTQPSTPSVQPAVPDTQPEQTVPSSSEPPQEEKPVYVDPYADALRNMDFTALREVNEDVLGWILIPNTRLSYPLVQGDDNEYYLNRTWKKSRNSVGAIFMEWRSAPDLSDFNTVIYGHRMNNRSMFGILHNYDEQSYWAKHPCIYITDDNGTHTYEIFSVYEAAVTDDTFRIRFQDDGEKQAFLDFCASQSVIGTGVVPNIWDQVLTLSTCTGDGHDTRWVVQAVKRGEPPAQPETEVPAPDVLPESEPAPSEELQ